MKIPKLRISRRQLILLITGTFCLFLALVISLWTSHVIGKQDAQHMAQRWDEDGKAAQISCFFSESAGVTEDTLLSFEYNLDKALVEASITNDSENESARLWASAYSAKGKVTIESDRATIDVDAIGVGGDFFLFHPLQLLTGAYFSGHDLMDDHIIIDEDAAWQLFGSNDVAGQIVYIGNVPHRISGVIRRDDSDMAKRAGLNSSVAYVSMNTLGVRGVSYGLNTYELVMPNPVKGYAKKYVAGNIGVAENNVVIVENSSRYDLIPRLQIMTEFGSRSMNSKAVIYPYWENIARGYEDIAVLSLFIVILLVTYPLVLLLIFVIRTWKRKKWTAKGIWIKVMDKKDDLLYKISSKIKNRKTLKQEKLEKAEEEFLKEEEVKNEEVER